MEKHSITIGVYTSTQTAHSEANEREKPLSPHRQIYWNDAANLRRQPTTTCMYIYLFVCTDSIRETEIEINKGLHECRGASFADYLNPFRGIGV